jgi:hypothetical protein
MSYRENMGLIGETSYYSGNPGLIWQPRSYRLKLSYKGNLGSKRSYRGNLGKKQVL